METKYISLEDLVEALMSYTWRDDDGFLIDDADEKRAYIEEWMPNIPAADVRPMHKKYIDGNELFRRIAGHSYYKGDDILARISLMQEGKSQNEDVKPADVRPVVRAKWENEIRLKDENGSLEWHGLCSRCLMTFSTFGVYAKRINFCPHCGADMRGKCND